MTNLNDLLNSNGNTFDPSAVEGIDQSMISDAGPIYPIMQWHTGDQKMKKAGGMDYLGGFFIKSDAIDDELMTKAGWEKTSWTHADGKEESGWWKRQVAISVISMRKRWEVYPDGGGRPLVFPWKSYDKAKAAGKASGRLQILTLVRGLEDAGAIVLTLRGMSALAFEGNNRDSLGCLGRFQQTVITAANLTTQASRKKWPLFAFWLPVGANRDAKDEPVFDKVGSGNSTRHIITPIPLGLPNKPQEVKNLGAFYVGNELLEVAKNLFVDASTTWVTAWDNLTPDQESGEAVTEEAAPEVVASNVDLGALGV
jgi:hypothetical protein